MLVMPVVATVRSSRRAAGSARAASPWLAVESAPAHWLGTTHLLDLDDPRLRLRVQSLVQHHPGARAAAVALLGYVRALPFDLAPRYGLRSARRILDTQRAAWYEKSTLLIAMLRVAGIPARMRIVTVPGDILRGLVQTHRPFFHPLVELWVDNRWVRTDIHIYDPAMLAAARRALMARGWTRGFGIHRNGQVQSDLRDDAYVALALDHAGGMPLFDHGVYNDVSEFLAHYREQSATRWAHDLGHFRLLRGRLRRAYADLRLHHGKVQTRAQTGTV